MGNICRSPMAEAVFQHMVDQAGLSDRIDVDSAGTSRWHVGEPPHPGTQDILAKYHIPYDGRARQIVRSDLNDFDYVLAMDRENLSFILRYATGATRRHSPVFVLCQRSGAGQNRRSARPLLRRQLRGHLHPDPGGLPRPAPPHPPDRADLAIIECCRGEPLCSPGFSQGRRAGLPLQSAPLSRSASRSRAAARKTPVPAADNCAATPYSDPARGRGRRPSAPAVARPSAVRNTPR